MLSAVYCSHCKESKAGRMTYCENLFAQDFRGLVLGSLVARALPDHIAPRRVRQRTLESYESAVREHLIPGIGRHRLDRLRPEHLDQLYTALLDDGYSPASVLRPTASCRGP